MREDNIHNISFLFQTQACRLLAVLMSSRPVQVSYQLGVSFISNFPDSGFSSKLLEIFIKEEVKQSPNGKSVYVKEIVPVLYF